MDGSQNQGTNRDGGSPPPPPVVPANPNSTSLTTVYYHWYLNQQTQPPPSLNRTTARLLRDAEELYFRSLPPASRTPLSTAELAQKLRTVSTSLVTVPTAATAASTDEAENQCGICQDVLVNTGDNAAAVIKINRCKHAFHEHCMVEWLDWVQRNRPGSLTMQASCPNCRCTIFANDTSTQTGVVASSGSSGSAPRVRDRRYQIAHLLVDDSDADE